jgi:hypothetical protein
MIRKCVAALLLFPLGALWAQRLLTMPDFSALEQAIPQRAEAIDKIQPLAGGGYVVQGSFNAWYEGKRYQDVLKLRANGDTDPSWRFNFSRQNAGVAYVDKVIVTPYGLAISGAFDQVDGVAVDGIAFVSLDTGKLLKQPVFQTYGNLPTFLTYDDATGYVYVVNRAHEMRRFSARTGEADPVWRFAVLWPNGLQPNELVADGKGGIWGSSELDPFIQSYIGMRVGIDAVATQLRIQTFYIPGPGGPFMSGDNVYFNKGRINVLDAGATTQWQTSAIPSLVSGKYAYFLTETTGDFIGRVSRAPTNGIGVTDDWGFLVPYAVNFRSVVTPWPSARDPDNLGVIVNYTSAPNTLKPALMIREDTGADEAPTVVEYYVPSVKRYFITGRKNEQTALDALPLTFIRTGMHFAAKSSRYRDIPELPVCRLYSSPDNGGSNSHFYGIGSDCALLNKLSGLKYEGYDFAVFKPSSTFCPAPAPFPVWRMFNNKSTTNEGNHRYVVSQATRSKMKAQGWLDEGEVFCSPGVTDAAS